jgi:hypothetical protein
MKATTKVTTMISIPRKLDIDSSDDEYFRTEDINTDIVFDISNFDYNNKDEEVCFIDANTNDGALLLEFKINELEYFAKSILLIIEAHRKNENQII